MRGNEALADVLKTEGTEYLFCFPANTLIEAAADRGIKPIMSRTERTTVNMADGYTRMTSGRKNGVVVTQAGPGIENAFGGIAQAYADSVPMLVLPGGTATGNVGRDPDFSAVQHYRGISKWTAQINQARRVPEMMRRAYTFLRSGRGAPVVLEVPGDVSRQELEANTLDYRSVKHSRSAGDPDDIRGAVKALLAAKNPVLFIGQGVLWAEACEELREFAELVGVPVATTNLGKGAFPEDHSLSLGTGGATITKMVRHFLDKADLVFGIGSSFTTNLASVGIPSGKVMVQCTVDARDLNKEHRLDHAVIGDARLVLQQLTEEARKQGGTSGASDALVEEIKQVKGEWLEEWMPLLTSDETPINPYRIIWDLMNTVDRAQSVVTHDAGHPRDQTIPFYEATTPHGYLGWGNSTQLGFSLGVAMGAKLAAPEKFVVNIMGDAAIGMAGMDIETALRLEIPILTIVFNNHVLSGYAPNYPSAVEKFGFTNLYGDYSAVAQALGAYSERIDNPREIVPAIKRAQGEMEGGRPALLEFMTKEENRLSRYPAG